MSSGRLFHKYGPACAKALCPHVLVDFGMIRAREVDERKFRAGIYGWTREILYWGAEPWTQWKISNKILKTMRSLIGSQCRDCKIGVMWVRLGDNVTMRAAAFWSFCNLDNWLWGRLCKSVLPKSSREEIKAWTIFSVAERDRYLRINPVLRNWYLTDLEILEIWDDIVKLESKITPRLRQVWDRLMVCPEKEIDWISILLSWAFEPKTRNSHFAKFSFKEWECIQTWISFMQASRRWTADWASIWFDLKETMSWISSA